MSSKPSRRSSSAIVHSGSTSSFWSTFAPYATEFAAVSGPLLEAIGQMANAIDRAERHNRLIVHGYPNVKTLERGLAGVPDRLLENGQSRLQQSLSNWGETAQPGWFDRRW